jgi:Glycosyl hydrolases family 2/Glycosyl hydrolases family 2, sugar binding domain/Glycosyl hydrolases family 2, TIM barrel domain
MYTLKLLHCLCAPVALTALWFLMGPADAADWKPADGPLVTRWAKDVKPDNALPEYPRPQMRREAWLNLNGLWQFAVAKENEEPPAGKDLTERILVPFPVESALSGVMKHADRLWYRRTFSVPKDWTDQRVLLHFGAVDWQATVWVNGKKLGDHSGGYDGFSLDITDAIDLKKADQELIVGVWDPTDAGTQPRGKQVNKPGGIFYTPVTGIWQTVWLEPVAPVSIEGLKIIPNVDANSARVDVKIRGKTESLTIAVTAKDGDKVVATADGKFDLPFVLAIDKPNLWSPEKPFLYDLHVELRQDGKKIDAVNGYFGMRKIEVGQPNEKGVQRIVLNGKPIFLRGPLDQGFWPDGIYTAPTDDALKYDIEITKKLGFNMTRKHVKVEPDRWYYWCDKLGLLVFQDMPSGDKSIGPGKPDVVRSPESAKQYDLELKQMVDGRYNHPSIIAWVVFNEGWGQFDTARVTEWAKLYDPSRLVDDASGWQDRKVGDVIDVHAYPGPGCPDSDGKRALVLGEFGGLGLQIDGHTWEKKIWGYRGVKDKDDLIRQYEKLWQETYRLKNDKGLSAAIYTQLTDVETEGNGLLTYDREVVKPDLARAAAAAGGDFSRVPQETPLVPSSLEKAQVWRYTLDKPGDDWMKPEFKDAEWKQGEGAFGAAIPGAPIRTPWKTDDIWIRREATLPNNAFPDPYLSMFHDEDAEVYFDGVPAAKVAGYNTGYDETPITPEALALLKPGKKIVVAVHCHQTTGGQFIDLGLSAVKPAAPAFRNDYFGKMPRAWVEILKIDPDRRVLTVRTKKGEEREVQLRGDTEMRVRDAWGDLSDLYPGESVMLFVYHDDAGAWAYPRAVQDEIQMMALHKWWWTVDALDAKEGVVALSRKDDKGKTVQEIFRIGDATKVWKGETPSGLDALKVGDVVLFQTRYEAGQEKRFAVEFMDEKGLEAIRTEQKAKHDMELAANGLPAVVNDIDLLTGAVHATVQWEAGDEARTLKPGSALEVLWWGHAPPRLGTGAIEQKPVSSPEIVRTYGKKLIKKFTAPLVESKAEGARQQLLLAADPAAISTLHVGDEVRVFPQTAK